MSAASVKGLAALRAQLGGVLPKGAEQLGEERAAALAGKLRAARERQRAELDQALNQALSHVPLLLRGAVRKLFEA